MGGHADEDVDDAEDGEFAAGDGEVVSSGGVLQHRYLLFRHLFLV